MDGRTTTLARIVALLVLLVCTLVLPAQAGPRSARGLPADGILARGIRHGADTSRLMLASIGWVFGHRPRAGSRSEATPLDARLRRESGWAELEFPLHDAGIAAYLEVTGRVGFEVATIRFDDGSERIVDLGRTTRGRGLYELLDFEGPRYVTAVSLRAIARSRSAQVGVRLGR